VLRAYSTGCLITDVQESERLSYAHVKHILDEAGVKVDRARSSAAVQTPRIRHLTLDEEAAVRARWGEKVGIVHIAKEVGVNPHVIERFVRQHLEGRSFGSVYLKRCPPRYAPAQVAEMIRQSTVEMRNAEDIARDFGCSGQLVTMYVRRSGVNGRVLQGAKLRLGYANGRIVVSPLISHGVKSLSDTPFQGTRVMRSRTESKRARLLDATGMAWFYEAHRYVLSDGSTYLPDFWLTEVPVDVARAQLGEQPDRAAIWQFLSRTAHWIEDTKGWFGSAQQNYGNHAKIHRFVAEGLHPRFSVLVMGRDTHRIFGTVPSHLEIPSLVP